MNKTSTFKFQRVMFSSLRMAHFGLLSQVSGKQCHFILAQVPFQTILNLCFSSGEDGKAVVALIDRLLLRSFQGV